MSFYMFLEVLGTLEGLAAKFASVWFQGDVDSDVRGNVVAFDHGHMAVTPCALQVKVVRAFASNMSIANVFLWISAFHHTKAGRAGALHRGLQRRERARCSLPTGRRMHRSGWLLARVLAVE